MGALQYLRDKFIIAPIARQLLESVRSTEKADQPAIFSVPTGFNGQLNQNKSQVMGNIDAQVLRSLSVHHETTRAAINTRKRQITQLGFDIVDLDEDSDAESTFQERQNIREYITQIGGVGVRFRELLDKLIEDVLVLDACVFYKQRARGGQLLRIVPIDAATIKLRVDEIGYRPQPPQIAFEQWIQGKKVAEMTTDEMTYEMMNPRTSSPYGLSPLESLIMTLDASMRAALYNLNYLSDNNIPAGFLTMPETWTVNQIKEYKEFFDSMVNGSKNTSKVFPIPAGTQYQPTSKPTDFSFEQFFDYLDRKVCMLFDVTPQELGLNLKQYKENAESQEHIQIRRGIKPLANFLSEIFTDIIHDELKMTKFAFKFTGLDGRFSIDDVKALTPIGLIGVDEARNDLGLKKIGVGNVVITAAGTITPLDESVNTTISGSGDNSQQDEEQQDVTNLVELPSTLHKVAKRNLSFERVERTGKYKEFYQEAKSALEAQLKPFTKKTVVNSLMKIVKSEEDDLDEEVSNTLPELKITGLDAFLKWAAEQGGQTAYDALKIKESFKLTNPKFEKLLGDRGNYLIMSVNDTTKDHIVQLILDSKKKAMTNDEVVNLLKSQIEGISSVRADMIVQTEVANAMQTAELDTYKDQGIEKKRWMTSDDDSVDEECAALDGEVVGVDESFSSGDDAPPLHPRCRCYIQAVIE